MPTTIELNDKQIIRLAIFANQREVTFADAIQILLDEAKVNQVNKNPLQGDAIKSFPKDVSGDNLVHFNTNSHSHRLEILYFTAESEHPVSETDFKCELLITKRAQVSMFYHDGRTEIKTWYADSMSDSSSVRGNLLAGYLRGWREKYVQKSEIRIISLDQGVSVANIEQGMPGAQLLAAVSRCDVQEVVRLIENGEPLNLSGIHQWTSLHDVPLEERHRHRKLCIGKLRALSPVNLTATGGAGTEVIEELIVGFVRQNPGYRNAEISRCLGIQTSDSKGRNQDFLTWKTLQNLDDRRIRQVREGRIPHWHVL